MKTKAADCSAAFFVFALSAMSFPHWQVGGMESIVGRAKTYVLTVLEAIDSRFPTNLRWNDMPSKTCIQPFAKE